MKHTIARILMVGSAAGGILAAGTAAAIDWNVTGFVRQEIAYGFSDNPNNSMSNPFNGRITPHLTSGLYGDGSNSTADASVYVDAAGRIGGLNYGATPGGIKANGFAPAGFNTSSAVDCQYGYQRAIAAGSPGFGPRSLAGDGSNIFQGTFCPNGGGTAYVPGVNLAAGAGYSPPGDISLQGDDDLNFNLFNTRVEVDVQAKINDEFSAYMKLRGYFDATRNFTDGNIGDHYENPFWGERRATITEWNSPDTIVDIPAMYLDWNRGPLWVRMGNQTIAWGEAYFFRTMDVANGLDLRRHLVLGPGAEEYQDQRIASPGIRLSYTFSNGWEVDSFVQMFSPSVLPGQETPYNVVPWNGARLDDSHGFDDAEGSLNYGARLNMPLTESFTGILAYVNRRNPDGVFRSVDAPTTNAGLVNGGCLNNYNDTLNFLANAFVQTSAAGVNGVLDALSIARFPTLNTAGRTMENGCGSAFAPDPLGTPALQYWPTIQAGRIDNGQYIRNVINDFPAAKWAVRDIFGFGDEQNFVDTYRTLEGFRSSFGPFVQWIGREFKRENIFMVGGNYVVTSENEYLDQLIVRGEVAVTPNKRLTNSLDFDYTEVDDVVSALIFEKYQRFSDAFPATYMVFQWMHRTSTDLFGRDLDNNNTPGIDTFVDPVTGNFTAAAFDPEAMKPRGSSSANYVVFAFQQPFPNLIWRFDMSILVDVAGGYLVQPGVRYRPSADWQWDLYATVIESPGGDNDTITESLDWADEMFIRLTYFF
jgi:hypothetical protein